MKALIALALLTLSCTPRPLEPVAPEPPDADAAVVEETDAARHYTCSSACKHGSAMGCAWGTSASCVEACNVRISSGLSKLSVACLSTVETCDTAACTK